MRNSLKIFNLLLCYLSILLTLLLVSPPERVVASECVSSASLSDDEGKAGTNQNLSLGAIDWVIFGQTLSQPFNQRNISSNPCITASATDRVRFALRALPKPPVATSFDFTDGTSPVAGTGVNPTGLCLVRGHFTEKDFFVLSFKADGIKPALIRVWGSRRTTDVRITASAPDREDVVTQLTGGGTKADTGWLYEANFTPSKADDTISLKIQPLQVKDTHPQRIVIIAAAIFKTLPPAAPPAEKPIMIKLERL